MMVTLADSVYREYCEIWRMLLATREVESSFRRRTGCFETLSKDKDWVYQDTVSFHGIELGYFTLVSAHPLKVYTLQGILENEPSRR